MSSFLTARSGLFARESLTRRLSLAGVGARRWGWQLVVDARHLIGCYSSQHPVGVPV